MCGGRQAIISGRLKRLSRGQVCSQRRVGMSGCCWFLCRTPRQTVSATKPKFQDRSLLLLENGGVADLLALGIRPRCRYRSCLPIFGIDDLARGHGFAALPVGKFEVIVVSLFQRDHIAVWVTRLCIVF